LLEKEDFVKYYQTARKRALSSVNIMSAWRKTGLIPLMTEEVLSKLPNKPLDPPNKAQLQLIVNGSPPMDLLVGTGSNYVEKATEAIKRTMLGSPAKQAIETIEFLNANNAILNKTYDRLSCYCAFSQGAEKGQARRQPGPFSQQSRRRQATGRAGSQGKGRGSP
jgi:hypothetical protein